jgi:hypothetical protein
MENVIKVLGAGVLLFIITMFIVVAVSSAFH